MKNRIVSDVNGTFLRIDKAMAERVFEAGGTIAVMTSDRNPVNSLATEKYYKKGCKATWHYGENGIIDSFDRVLEDFGEFLICDGYGHMPDPVRGFNHQFSYWVKVEDTKRY